MLGGTHASFSQAAQGVPDDAWLELVMGAVGFLAAAIFGAVLPCLGVPHTLVMTVGLVGLVLIVLVANFLPASKYGQLSTFTFARSPMIDHIRDPAMCLAGRVASKRTASAQQARCCKCLLVQRALGSCLAGYSATSSCMCGCRANHTCGKRVLRCSKTLSFS